ncbi:DUF1798 family protein [Virgibacillus sp. 179-BFC.A HS]|uniref:DUF1798 family protein n=1 Tax=Tigheibacillus jepli TaxID=3035914 RepID=A0ABU5CIE1_9BACI|nr:DUF1798 family protein [Virgibacillus sp. 179-BFC.A HS]MDY0405731.1 DUF1798 family protein [Virgibacillus sp. 179-BFC.A HS]
MYQLLEQWETNALAAVKEKKANVHPQQIISTRENMGLLLMHSFYIDIRKRRYMEIYYSCMYVFDLLAKSLQENFTAGEE